MSSPSTPLEISHPHPYAPSLTSASIIQSPKETNASPPSESQNENPESPSLSLGEPALSTHAVVGTETSVDAEDSSVDGARSVERFPSVLSDDSVMLPPAGELSFAPTARFPPFQYWATYGNSTLANEALAYWVGAVQNRPEFRALRPHVLPSFQHCMSKLLGDIYEIKDQLEMLGQRHDNIRRLLKCKLCDGPFRSPVMLSCGHVYCGICLRNAFQFRFSLKLYSFIESNMTDGSGDIVVSILPFESRAQLERFIERTSERYPREQVLDLIAHACPSCREPLLRKPTFYNPLDFVTGIINNVPMGLNPVPLFEGLFLD